MGSKYFPACSVALLTFLVFLPSLGNDFVNWDDDLYVYRNDFIRSLDARFLKAAVLEFHAAYWHPVTWLSHALDYALWGLNPLGHHLTNVILHALNAFLVVLLIQRLLMAYRNTGGLSAPERPLLSDRTIMIAAMVTGALFGIHPLRVESVAWVSERKDLLCAFFFLLSIIVYAAYVNTLVTPASRKQAPYLLNKWYLLSLGSFVLSLLSKQMSVTLPVVLLILDWSLFRRMSSSGAARTAIIEKLPFFAFSMAASVLIVLAHASDEGLRTLEQMPLASRLLVAPHAVIAYLGKTLWPAHLVPLYPYPERVSLFSLEYGLPVVLVTAITAACIAAARTNRTGMAIWTYYVVTLLPALGLVQVGTHSMADRFTYIPGIGPILAVGLSTAIVYERTAGVLQGKFLLRMAVIVGALIMIGALSFTTIRQIGVWKDGIVFWKYVVDHNDQGVPLAHNNLGDAYLSGGRPDAAIEQLQIAVRLLPNYPEAHYNLGIAYNSLGQFDLARDQFQSAVALRPDYVEAYNNLGNVYLSQGLLGLAAEQFRHALKLRPELAEPHFNLGLVYLKQGMKDTAKTELELGLARSPDNDRAREILNSIH